MNRKFFWIWAFLLGAALMLTSCGDGSQTAELSSEPAERSQAEYASDPAAPMQIRVQSDTQTIVFELNDSPAAQSFYEQLPLSISVEDYAGSEKLFYPPEGLDVSDTPLAEGPAGTLAYYEPWGNVAMFYGDCSGASGLYELGQAVSGAGQIQSLTGDIRIEKEEESSTGEPEADTADENELSSHPLQQATENTEPPPEEEEAVPAPAEPPSTEPSPNQTADGKAPEAPHDQMAEESSGSQAVESQDSKPSSNQTTTGQDDGDSAAREENETMNMHVQIGDHTFTATLESNAAVDALVEMMESGPVTIQMNDYAGFEKVGPLGTSLPTSNHQTTTHAGDIVLYQGDQIVLFYGSNSWSYTRIGKIDDLSGWEEALGSGHVTVVFSLPA